MKCLCTKYILLTIALILISGCDNTIDISYPDHEGELVVEGWIEQGEGCKIHLTKSAPFFTDIDSINLLDYAVTKAKVTLIGEDESEILTLTGSKVYFPPYYYISTDMVGEQKQRYTLEISLSGKTYMAETTIPALVNPDSVWFEKLENSDTLGRLKVIFTDNASERNYYRLFTKTIGKEDKFTPAFTSVFSDEQFNGESIEISVSRGNASLLDTKSNRYFTLNDTVILKFCSIDKPHYDFWNTYQGLILTSVNPFAVSNKQLEGNVSDAIGVWGGYAASYDTVIAR
ncbi:MAG: DUF4249 domain-containing protein [Bacteroidales bacterium]|nr:DUF4249 domain-containing protein [Bacteroidales bacterium]